MSQNYWYRLLFRVRLHESDGTGFQRLVAQTFHATYADFQSVQAWGSAGDGGNDGFVPSSGHYLQVYGPGATSSWTPVAAVKKALEDFGKLKENWRNLRRYSFVLNDRFAGVPAPVHQALQDIQAGHDVNADAIAAAHLTDMFMVMPDDRKQDIVGGIPADTPPHYSPSELGDLLRHLADRAEGAGLASKKFAPDFEAKIVLNGLSDALAARMRDRSYEASVVDRFLETRDQYLAQAISIELRDLYDRSKNIFSESLDDRPDLQYVWMVDQIIPESARSHPHSLKAYRAAAEVVLARYFEACDVYEQPTSSSCAS